MTRDPYIIDQELRLLAVLRVATLELGWEPPTRPVDELLDERIRASAWPMWP